MQRIIYNERSWAIDIISKINLWINKKDLLIHRAGGENSIRSENGILFPDILLFGDELQGKILQGWELKFPDTLIDNTEFIENAKKKAISLNLNSFILWNVSHVVLYLINDDGSLSILRSWNDLAFIDSREKVFSEKERIFEFLGSILPIINSYLHSGLIQTSTISSVLSSENFFNIIQSNVASYSRRLEDHALSNRPFADEVNVWWRYAKNDFPEENNKYHILARNNLFFLLNKFIFAHLLKSFNQRAFLVDEINENSTINEAINKFESISEACDYWDIFNKHTGEETIDSLIWNDFRNLNQLLKEFQIQFIDRSLLRHLLNELIIRHKRKIAGQFATPQNLARLMVACSISDRNAQTLDPCCGSGTIINEIYKYKTQALNSAESYDTTWGSDKFAFPLLIASINFSDPQAFGTLRRLFKADASELHTGQEISFHDPFTGNITNINLPQFKNIISNLPFVKQEDIRLLNPNIGNINLMISDEIGELKALDGRSDLYGYLPFYFYHLLEPQGKITIITSNSWVGTSWGEQFIKLLKHYYLINSIVISGYGRWFPDAKVVTTVLILDKKDLNENNINQSTKFITLKKKIEDFNSDEIDEISAVINSKSLVNEKDLTIISYSNEKIDSIRNIGLNFNSFFTDNNWLEEISDHLIKVNRVFDISRGERRGWDLFFYPNSENNIEDDYLKPVLITPSSSNRLFANPDSKAFCCTLSKVQLRELNHLGALEWIERFEHQTNKVGLPLQEVLKKANSFWYTFTPRISNEFVASINYGDRLFFSMLNQPTIVNQRLIRFSRINQEVDIHLCHALLNSILGLFYLEAIGFGRGEGVLDLNKNYFKNHYQILNPSMINSYSKQKILDAFTPLCQRPISPLIEELEKDDRNNFDSIILDEFGLLEYFPKIKNSLIDLFSIRNSVLY